MLGFRVILSAQITWNAKQGPLMSTFVFEWAIWVSVLVCGRVGLRVDDRISATTKPQGCGDGLLDWGGIGE